MISQEGQKTNLSFLTNATENKRYLNTQHYIFSNLKKRSKRSCNKTVQPVLDSGNNISTGYISLVIMVKFFFFFKEHSASPRHLLFLQKSRKVNLHSTYYFHWPLSQNSFSQVEGRYFARIIYYAASSAREINWAEYERHPGIVVPLSLTQVRCKISYNLLYLGEQPSLTWWFLMWETSKV